MRVLIDTSALLALSRARDQYHRTAVNVARRHLKAGGRFIGTTLVLAELHGHLRYLRGTAEARTALRNLLDDPAHTWIDVSAQLIGDAASRWLERFADQAFSLTDAVSFEVMRRENLVRAFAFDHHFQIAGFQLLK